MQSWYSSICPVDRSLHTRDDPAVDNGPDGIARAFGKALAEARKKAGLTQEELANRSAVHRTQVGLLEHGKSSPQLETVIRLAGGIGIEPSALIPPITWQPPRPRGGGAYLEGEEAETHLGSD